MTFRGATLLSLAVDRQREFARRNGDRVAENRDDLADFLARDDQRRRDHDANR